MLNNEKQVQNGASSQGG